MRLQFLRDLYAWWLRWYRGEISRQRHAVEEDARRLNGTVSWND